MRHIEIAIIGSGPGGLSAAMTAARLGLPHLLLERAPQLADTIWKYQKGKPVMAQPAALPLVADLPFEAGSREDVLAAWTAAIEAAGVNYRCNAEVQAIVPGRDSFVIAIAGQPPLMASKVVLAIGLQGNLRKLGIPGDKRHFVQYQLEDPEAYRNERILVIGAGDSAIENALALARHNDVAIVNRAAEFVRAQPANLVAIERAIRQGVLRGHVSARPVRIEENETVLATPEGEIAVPCDRVIARLGAVPPRSFVESCGVRFPTKDSAAVPALSRHYETSVPGLFIVGALAGYELIKQAINQGREIIQHLAGQPVEPADQALLAQRFAAAYPGRPVEAVLAEIRQSVPLLAGLGTLKLRAVLLDSTLHRLPAGATVVRKGDYTNSLYGIIAGEARVEIGAGPEAPPILIRAGEFFGELGLISGRRRTDSILAATELLAVEIARRPLLRLQRSERSVKEALDRVALRRLVNISLGQSLPPAVFDEVCAGASLRSLDPNEAAISEGEPCDALYIVRRGSMTVTRESRGGRIALGFVAAGEMFGERGVLEPDARRVVTVRAAVEAEVIRLDVDAVRQLVATQPQVRERLQGAMQQQVDASVRSTVLHGLPGEGSAAADAVIPFLVAQGIGEATNALIIDEALCIGCDNCESACAATHGGVTRLHREAGASFASVKLPIACRHCEKPHCMSDCPVNAITRAPSGEVMIDDSCIGCGNCVRDCPYEVITLAAPMVPEAGSWDWLRRGLGLAPRFKPDAAARKVAVKCDLCKEIGGGPACVRACPTGAAARLAPEAYLELVRDGKLPNRPGGR